MAKTEKTTDMYMNWKPILGSTGADSSALYEYPVQTGLSIRGGLIWLIHLIEYELDGQLTSNFTAVRAAISTRKGLTEMPTVDDDGVLATFKDLLYHVGGSVIQSFPRRSTYLPPPPLAAPNLSLYVQGAANHADGQNKPVGIRIGFTTAPLDAAAYTEIAETWSW